jgi:hypothetical protein
MFNERRSPWPTARIWLGSGGEGSICVTPCFSYCPSMIKSHIATWLTAYVLEEITLFSQYHLSSFHHSSLARTVAITQTATSCRGQSHWWTYSTCQRWRCILDSPLQSSSSRIDNLGELNVMLMFRMINSLIDRSPVWGRATGQRSEEPDPGNVLMVPYLKWDK